MVKRMRRSKKMLTVYPMDGIKVVINSYPCRLMWGHYPDTIGAMVRFHSRIPIMLPPADPVAGLRSLLTNVRLIPGVPYNAHVGQLVESLRWGRRCWRFESSHEHQFIHLPLGRSRSSKPMPKGSIPFRWTNNIWITRVKSLQSERQPVGVATH